MSRSKYPTGEQILARAIEFDPRVLRAVHRWRRDYAGQLRTTAALTELIQRLARLHGLTQSIEVRWRRNGRNYARVSSTPPVIGLDASHPSIVTALHELAHHLFGSSELTACRWSVQLYRAAFPRTFARCTFKGHMLVIPRRTHAIDRHV